MIFKVPSNPHHPVILWIEHQPPQAPQGEPKDAPDHPPQALLHPRSPCQGQTLRVTPGWASSTHPAPGERQTKELSWTRQLNEQEKPRGRQAGAREEPEQAALLTSGRSWLAVPSVRLSPRRSPATVTQTPTVLPPFHGQSILLLQPGASTPSKQGRNGGGEMRVPSSVAEGKQLPCITSPSGLLGGLISVCEAL